tara:strand:+ start:1768 stop:2709 length:942 start_codon:yes stop_codon:yes gene_type:complete
MVTNASLENAVSTLKEEVDGLQVQFTRLRGPWYRNPSTVVAFLALLFSFGTTLVSYLKEESAKVAAAKRELRELIQQVSAIPQRNLEYAADFAQYPQFQTSINGLLTQENALLASQASEIMDSIPNVITSSEYLMIANALAASGINNRVQSYYEKAIVLATNANDDVTAHRNLGYYLIRSQDLEGGRAYYQKAREVFDRFPSDDAQYIIMTNAMTEAGAGVSESMVGNTAEAIALFDRAEVLVQDLLDPTMKQQLLRSLQQSRSGTSMLVPSPAPSAPHSAPTPVPSGTPAISKEAAAGTGAGAGPPIGLQIQ